MSIYEDFESLDKVEKSSYMLFMAHGTVIMLLCI